MWLKEINNMFTIFRQGQVLKRGDLDIFVRDSSNQLIDPVEISYAIYDKSDGIEVLVAGPGLTPVRVDFGSYFAPYKISEDSNVGRHIIKWDIREATASALVQINEDYMVASTDLYLETLPGVPMQVRELVTKLRIMLRDNHPDRNYHFRPPAYEDEIQKYTEKFGYIWTDLELLEYLLWAADGISMYPPETTINIENVRPGQKTILLVFAAVHALRAVTLNWIADEFNYSISGVSLDLEKSSKYQSMKENYEAEAEKLIDALTRSVHITRGLRHSRFVGGGRFRGPFTGSGVTTTSTYLDTVRRGGFY